MAHPRHELLGARTGRSDERVAGVPKVMEVEVGQADLSAGVLPDHLPDVATERAALLAGEEQRLVVRLDMDREVLRELICEHIRQRHDPNAGVGLGRTEYEGAVLQLMHLPRDRER